MLAEIIYYGVAFLFHSALLMAALWIMIKLQGFNYNFLGLLGTAAAGGALDMIPYVGHALAVITLYTCITKMTRASMFPDAAFTVAVAFALMFAAKILLFTALIGNFHFGSGKPDTLEADETSSPAAWDTTNITVNASAPTPTASQPTRDFVQKLVIKGTTLNGANSSVTVNCEGKNYVIFTGETAALPGGDKTMQLRLEAVGTNTLTFNLNGEQVSRLY